MSLEPRFDSLTAFLQMDGQGGYIWAAYGITVIVLLASLWWPRVVRRRFVAMEKPLAEMEQRGTESQ